MRTNRCAPPTDADGDLVLANDSKKRRTRCGPASKVNGVNRNGAIGRHTRGILVCMRVLKFIVEKHPDGYIAYPLILRGVVAEASVAAR